MAQYHNQGQGMILQFTGWITIDPKHKCLALIDLHTVAAPLIAAASNQKIFSSKLAAASIQERPLIKK